MTTKITVDNLAPTLVTTIEAGGGPKISNVKIANVSYTLIDDTAVSLGGGYIIVNGTGFESNVNLLIDGTAATSVTRISATEIRAQIPALTAGSKVVYLTNTDTGATAIRVNGVTYSGTPTWVTGSTLTNGVIDEAISIQLSANSDSNVSYQLQSGSTLPTGLTLAANGLLTGTVTGITQETLYNFTVEAIDAENQESPRSFSITITVGDEYFNYTTLLLTGDGANAAQNNTFLDSSANNFTITRNGNATQGSFSPFSQTGWSNYFGSSTSDNLKFASNAAFGVGTGNFSVEFFLNVSSWSGNQRFFLVGASGTDGISIARPNANSLAIDIANSRIITHTWTPTVGFWYHIALVRSGTGSNQTTLYINGSSVATGTSSGSVGQNPAYIGGLDWATSYNAQGYISNMRFSNTARTVTVPTAPYTSDANTIILSCQSNRFRDASTNNFAITVNGNTSVQAFSPFAPTAAYSAATVGGSGYFDGSGDYLSAPDNAALEFGSSNFTMEGWFYPTDSTARYLFAKGNGALPGTAFDIVLNVNRTVGASFYSGASFIGSFTTTGTLTNNAWNHVAIVRNGNTFTGYINGVSSGTGSSSSSIENVSTGITVGTLPGIGNTFLGYCSDFRVVVGTAVYTSAFTPPTTPLTAISNTQLLLSYTNGGIIDNTAKNVLETVGNAQISTSVKKFGTGSILLTPGAGSHYTRVPLTENLRFGTGNFTIECWIYLITNVAGICAVWSNYSGFSAGSLSLFAGHASASTNNFYIAHNGGFPALASTTTVNSRLGLWTHLAVVRNSGQIKLYVNGVSEGTPFASTVALDGVGSYFWVGTTGDSPGSNPNCYIDDFRITKGIARYTANFTPPTSAHKIR